MTCPFCRRAVTCDTVDVGVGEMQVGQYDCFDKGGCGAAQGLDGKWLSRAEWAQRIQELVEGGPEDVP